MMRTAVVTGGAGFIGRRLVERMASNGWRVTIVDDMSTHDKKTMLLHEFPQANYLSVGRVQDHNMASVTKLGKPDLIVHLAGKVGPLGVLKFRGQIAKDTIDAAHTVADWALEFGCPLIDISTSEVYGNDDIANAESHKPVIQHPSARSEYAVAKLAAEHMLFNKDGLDVRVIRPFNIAGYGQRTDGGFVIPRFVEQALNGDNLTVYTPGTQERSFTHVDDFIDGLAVVYKRGTSREVYNIGNPYNKLTMEELAQQVIARTGSGVGIELVDPVYIHGEDFKDAPDKIPYSVKMFGLGWHPYRGTGEIVQDSIAYYMEKRYESSGIRVPYTEQARPYAKDAW